MKEIFRRYPIGIQNFEDLRNNNCVYIDKTALIYQLTHTDKVYFLSRPRRFGKSLLISTLEAYFSGKKELFEGLAMEQLEKEWTVYPVLHIDFSKNCEDIYNPFSLFNAFSQKDYKSFWFSTGTSTFLIEMLHGLQSYSIGKDGSERRRF